MDNYKILQKIGAGNFAKVYLAIHMPTGRKVALKVIEKRAVSSPKKLIQKVRREIGNLKKLRHRSVVEIYESFESKSQFVIVMEYLPNGELFDYVWERQGLKESEARDIFTRIAEGVHHCHLNSIVHRDLKLENILLDTNNHPKLADFGFSKEVKDDQFLETYCGSPLYASPEMILGKPYFGSECDVWSLGVILYTMLTAAMPFDDRNIPLFMSYVEKGIYPEPSKVSKLGKDLISRMLDPHPTTRATIEEVLSHPWLQKSISSPRIQDTSLHSHENIVKNSLTITGHNERDSSSLPPEHAKKSYHQHPVLFTPVL